MCLLRNFTAYPYKQALEESKFLTSITQKRSDWGQLLAMTKRAEIRRSLLLRNFTAYLYKQALEESKFLTSITQKRSDRGQLQ